MASSFLHVDPEYRFSHGFDQILQKKNSIDDISKAPTALQASQAKLTQHA